MNRPASEPVAVNPANTLGLDYRRLATQLPWRGPIWDAHTHIHDVESAKLYFEVAELFGVQGAWSMTPSLEQVDRLRDTYGDRIRFIAVPNYADKDSDPHTFSTSWLKRIELYHRRGCRIVKFWAAPRGRDVDPALHLDSPVRREGMRLAASMGMHFMVHVADPDTWFATKYADAAKYGTKAQQYEPLERMLDEFPDCRCIAAHMGGSPENLDFVQGLLDRHPNLYVDTSATKWMVRELSKHPGAFAAFCRRNCGRVLFGTDLVTQQDNMDFDLYASRFWALRTLIETDYDGPSPIVDPDLHLVDPTVREDATARLRGAKIPADVLGELYHHAAAKFHS